MASLAPTAVTDRAAPIEPLIDQGAALSLIASHTPIESEWVIMARSRGDMVAPGVGWLPPEQPARLSCRRVRDRSCQRPSPTAGSWVRRGLGV